MLSNLQGIFLIVTQTLRATSVEIAVGVLEQRPVREVVKERGYYLSE